MKKLISFTMLIFISCLASACSNSSDDSGNLTSDSILSQIVQSGSSLTDEPTASLIEDDVIEITCDENDYTEGGALFVSCLDDGESQLDVAFLCDAGYIYYESGEQYDSIEGTCVKLFCINGGEDAYVQSCDVGNSSALAIEGES